MANILITGAGKGFGFLIAKTLLRDGHTVVATMRGVDGRNKGAAEALRGAKALTAELDVTDEESVEKGVAKAIEAAGGLDVVVNNSGLGALGLQECFSLEDWKRVFDVNVFGAQRVNRAVLPHMRERRCGLLIHISSLQGRMVMPYYGPYSAAKFALGALADNYRVELSAFGIESVLVEPGSYDTTFVDALLRPSDGARIAQYGPHAQAPEAALESYKKNFMGPQAPNPQWVADAVSDLVKTPRGKRCFHTIVDRHVMGAAVKPYNKLADELQKHIYAKYGMADSLKLQI